MNANDIIRKYYQSEGAAYCAALSGLSVNAVQKRAQRMGIPGKSCKLWKNENDTRLAELYPTCTAEAIAERLGTNVRAVRRRVVELGLRKRYYVRKKNESCGTVASQLANQFLRKKI